MECNHTITYELPVLSCLILQPSPNGSAAYCALSSYENARICVSCPIAGTQVAGENKSLALAVAALLCTLTVLIGLAGIILNGFVIIISRWKRKGGTRTDFSLIALACFDITASLTSIMASISFLVALGSWGCPSITVYFLYAATYLSSFGRSGSCFMTVLITVKRCVVVAFPIASRAWFTPARTKMLAGGILSLSIFLTLPRFLACFVYPITEDISGLADSGNYIIMTTSIGQQWWMTFVDGIDFLAPVSLLLTLNIVFIRKMRKVVQKRKRLNLGESREMKAIRMVFPAAISVVVCNISPALYFYHLYVGKEHIYREHFLTTFLSITATSVMNPFWYWMKFGRFRAVLKEWRASVYSPPIKQEKGRNIDEDRNWENSTGTLYDGFRVYV